MKAAPDVSESADTPRTIADVQPRPGASFRPISSAASETASSKRAGKSKVRSAEKSASALGSSDAAVIAATAPGPTLTRNSHCQLKVAVIQPPTIGPTVGASTASMPANPVAKRLSPPRKQQEYRREYGRDH